MKREEQVTSVWTVAGEDVSGKACVCSGVVVYSEVTIVYTYVILSFYVTSEKKRNNSSQKSISEAFNGD